MLGGRIFYSAVKSDLKERENMDESTTYTACELEFIGEGYEPSWAVEICANEEGRHSDEPKEKSDKVLGWEYLLG